MARSPQPVIGIVGGIGSGKSAVAEEFAALGCVPVDADRIGHALLDAPEVRAAVTTRFDEGVLAPTGRIDRDVLGRIVFGSADAMTGLTYILWPRMGTEIQRRIEQAPPDAAGVVLDAAVLFEAGWDAFCSETVFVDVPWEVRLRRVRSRGWSAAELARREGAQIPLDKKRDRCCYILCNRSSPHHLREQVRRCFHTIQQTR